MFAYLGQEKKIANMLEMEYSSAFIWVPNSRTLELWKEEPQENSDKNSRIQSLNRTQKRKEQLFVSHMVKLFKKRPTCRPNSVWPPHEDRQAATCKGICRAHAWSIGLKPWRIKNAEKLRACGSNRLCYRVASNFDDKKHLYAQRSMLEV